MSQPLKLPSSTKQLFSFDGTNHATTRLYRPDRYRDLTNIVSSQTKICLRGAGLSYALASSSNSHPTVDLRLFNRFLSFDSTKGLFRVEAGVTLGEILVFAVKNNWNIGVLPGHPSITVGGCVAFNVHGKSQFLSGNFENIVASLTLLHPDHGEIFCSRDDHPELFWLTIGGMGLTGVIIDVTLQLSPLKGSMVERTAIPCDNLLDACEQMRTLESKFDYLYSWNNFCRRGKNFGRGVIYAEKFIGDATKPSFGPLTSKLKPVGSRPRFAAFRGETAALINGIYEIKERLTAGTKCQDIGPATFPIAGKEFYFSLLGRQGFFEYQCLVPEGAVTAVSQALGKLMADHGIRPSLGSLKYFRGQRRDLCFLDAGVCIAIDLPIAGHPEVLTFLKRLDELIIDHGGIANIAKDSRISREIVQRMYPNYESFWQKLKKWDPAGRFTSEMRCRLEPV